MKHGMLVRASARTRRFTTVALTCLLAGSTVVATATGPVGATGAILVTKALHELHRIGGRYALTTMCIGGGQGIAAIFERG